MTVRPEAPGLPLGWVSVPLSDLGSWAGGGTPAKDNPAYWTNANIPWVSPKDMKSFEIHDTEDHITEDAVRASATRRLPAGSVLMVTRSGILKHTFPVAVARTSVALNQDLKAVTPYEGLHSAYIAYALRSFGRAILDSCSKDGTTVQSIESPALKRFQIPLAPEREQVRIADTLDEVLSDLDAGVAALERARDKLKLYRASVLKAAVDGTLTAKWRAQHRNTEPAGELLKRVLAERRRLWEEDQVAKCKRRGQEPPKGWKAKYKEPLNPDTTKLPSLPEGWCWASWPQVGLSQNGRPFPSNDYSDSGAKLLRPGNLYASGVVGWTKSNTRFMPDTYDIANPDLILGGGELVINLTAQSLKDDFLGRVCVTPDGERCLLNQRLARLTPILLSPRFVLWLFKSVQFRKFVAGLNTGSLIQHIFTSQLDDFMLPLPPLAEQDMIVEAVDDQFSIIDHAESALDTKLKSAQGLRQSILRHAFAGQLVPQDLGDEPATELLKRIAAERDARERDARERSMTKAERPAKKRATVR